MKTIDLAGRGVHPVPLVHALSRRFHMNNAGGVNTPPGTRLQCLKVQKKDISDPLIFQTETHSKNHFTGHALFFVVHKENT